MTANLLASGVAVATIGVAAAGMMTPVAMASTGTAGVPYITAPAVDGDPDNAPKDQWDNWSYPDKEAWGEKPKPDQVETEVEAAHEGRSPDPDESQENESISTSQRTFDEDISARASNHTPPDQIEVARDKYAEPDIWFAQPYKPETWGWDEYDPEYDFGSLDSETEDRVSIWADDVTYVTDYADDAARDWGSDHAADDAARDWGSDHAADDAARDWGSDHAANGGSDTWRSDHSAPNIPVPSSESFWKPESLPYKPEDFRDSKYYEKDYVSKSLDAEARNDISVWTYDVAYVKNAAADAGDSGAGE